MANTYVPDQSEDFKRSGVRLITDPASDALLSRSQENRDRAVRAIDKVKEG